MNHIAENYISFNIWDDYDDSEWCHCNGYIEEYDLYSEEEKFEMLRLVHNWIISKTSLRPDLCYTCITFENLIHIECEDLVEKLQNSGLEYNGTLFNFYSES